MKSLDLTRSEGFFFALGQLATLLMQEGAYEQYQWGAA